MKTTLTRIAALLAVGSLFFAASCGRKEAAKSEEPAHAEKAEHAAGEAAEGKAGHAAGEAAEGKAEHAASEAARGKAELAAGEAAEGVVTLNPEQVKSAGIAIVKVEGRAELGLLEATAEIEPAADRQSKVGARVPGRVVSLGARVGDRVAKGAVLATIDSPELGRAKADYVSAIALERVAEGSSAREKALFEKRISAEKDFRDAEAGAIRARAEREAAENRLHALGVLDGDLAAIRREGHYSSTLGITSPLAGIVTEVAATLGQSVDASAPLFTVMDLREVWIAIDVYERNIESVRIGQTVQVCISAFPDRKFEGTVKSIASTVEAKTRSVKVRVTLPNPDATLKPGMFATVLIVGSAGGSDKAGEPALLVPVAAIQREGDRSIVFVVKGPGQFMAREVKTGHEAGGLVHIEKGLKAGESVVTAGSFVLKSEMEKSEMGEGHGH